MSRGGRGGRGGRRNGPDIAWDDEPLVIEETKPEPLFPEVDLTTPRPLSETEEESVNAYLKFRDLVRTGPYYSVLDPTAFTDDHGKVNKRAGFDPFLGMEKYTSKYEKPRRSMPDLSGREYKLDFFPRELWSVLDPKKTNPAWKSLPATESSSATQPAGAIRKRKRAPLISEAESSSDSDAVVTTSRRKRPLPQKPDDPTKLRGQKAGLEAEDDIPDIEQDDDDGDGEEDAPQDSEFEESDDGAGDDYNAENYFDTGEADDWDDGGGGDGEGGSYE